MEESKAGMDHLTAVCWAWPPSQQDQDESLLAIRITDGGDRAGDRASILASLMWEHVCHYVLQQCA